MLQELMLKKDLLLSPTPAGTNDLALQQQQQQHAAAVAAAAANVGIDPFLGQATVPTAATLESHARQNSADSGLGEKWGGKAGNIYDEFRFSKHFSVQDLIRKVGLKWMPGKLWVFIDLRI